MSDNLEQQLFSKQAGFEATLGTFEQRVKIALKELKEKIKLVVLAETQSSPGKP